MRSLAFFIVTSITLAAAEPAPWANRFFVKDATPAVITHDFGTVPHGTVLVHKLTITNIYDVPMQVIDVRKSCTCLDATVPQQVLQPHDTAEVTLVMNSAKFNGANAQSFFITFGPQYVSTAVIRVSAVSRNDVTLSPGQVNFGIVAPGTTPTQNVTVKYSGKQRDWKITGVVPPSGPIDVQVKEGRAGLLGLGNPEFGVVVSLKEGAPAGTLQETVSFKTNDPTAPVLQLSVAGIVQAPISVSPSTVSFGSVKLGQTVEARVMVRAAKALKVEPAAVNADGIAVESFPVAAPTQFITLKYTAKSPGKLSRAVTIQTDLGPVSVSVEGEAVP